jgi:hypothetical protein
MREGCLLSSVSLSIVLQFLAKGVKERNKGIQIVKEEVILSLLANDMSLYLKTLKSQPKNS